MARENGKYMAVVAIKRDHLLAFIFLALITALLYANSLKNSFFFDDYTELVENQWVQHPGHFFGSSPHGDGSLQDIRHFRPIPLAFRISLYQFFKQDPFYYHLTNVVLLLIFVCAAFIFFLELTKDQFVSLLSAMLLCAHPQNTTPVNFIIANEALFYPFFGIWMLVFFMRYLRQDRNLKYYALSLIFYLFVILSHDSAFLSFIAIFLMAWLFFQEKFKTALKLSLPYFFCAIVYGLILVFSQRSTSDLSLAGEPMPIHAVFFCALRLIGWYLTQLMVPAHFVFMWSLKSDPYQVFWKGLAVLLIIMGSLVLLWKNRQEKFLAFAGLWFWSGFLPVGLAMFVYRSSLMGLVIEPTWFMFTSLGFFLGLGWLLGQKGMNPRINAIKYTVAIVLTVYWGGCTIRYNEIWRTGISYSQYWLKEVPENIYALCNMAREYLRQNQPQQAVYYLNQVLKQGEHSTIYDDLGRAYFMMNRPQEARTYFVKALSLNHQDATAANGMGIYFSYQNNFSEAETYYTLALKNAPNNTSSLMNLMFCYYKTREDARFYKTLAAFFDQNPDADAALSLTKFALDLKSYDLALYFSDGGMKLFSKTTDALRVYKGEGEIFANHGLLEEAVRIWQQGLGQFPGNEQLQDLIQKNR